MTAHTRRAKRVGGLSLAALTAMSLAAACGRADEGAATGGATGAAVSTGSASGTLDMWAMGSEGENLPKLVSDFTAANPGITVNVTAIPWDAAHDKFTTAITAGKTPDLAMVGTTWMGEFAAADALDPTPSNIDKSGFFDGAQKSTEVNGTSYGVPWYVDTRVLYYRTDLAKTAGYDKAPTDWPGLKDMAKAMQTKAGAKFGIGLQAGGTGSWETLMPFAWTNGADLTKDGGKAYNFDSPQLTEALQYYQSYFTDGISDKAAPAQPTTEPDFASGKVPMFISGPWEMSAVEKVGGQGFKDKYAVAPIPAKTQPASFVGGSNLAVFKTTKNRDAAWKLVQFLSDPKTQVKWYQLSTDLPALKSAWTDPALSSDQKLAVFGKQLETAKAPPSFPTWEQVVKKLDTGVEQVTKQGADPASTLKQVEADATSVGTGQ